MNKSTLATGLFYLIPLAYILPQELKLFNITILWVDIVCWLGLIFFARFDPRKIKELISIVILLGIITITSNVYGMITVGYEFNLKNYSFIKYITTYIGAIYIGLNLPVNKLFKNKLALVCWVILFVMCLCVIYSPNIGWLIADMYNQKNLMDLADRMVFMDSNPNMIGQIAIVLAMLSLPLYKKSRVINTLIIIGTFYIILLTSSRGNMIIFIVFLYLYKFYKMKLRYLVLLFAGTVILFSVMLTMESSAYTKQNVSRISNISDGITKRLSIFKYYTSEFIDSPLIGKGYRKNYSRGNVYIDYFRTNHVEVHSQWLGFTFNHGLLGLGSLLIFFVAILMKLQGLKKIQNIDDPVLLNVTKFLSAAFFCYFISMVGWETLYLPVYSTFFFVVFGKIYQLSYDQRLISDKRMGNRSPAMRKRSTISGL